MKATGTYGLYAQISLLAQQEPLSLLAWEAKEMFLKSTPCFSLTVYYIMYVVSDSGREWKPGCLP